MKIKAVFFDMGGTIDRYGFTPEMRLKVTPGIQRRLLDAGIDLGFTNEQLYHVVSTGWDAYHRWSLTHLEELPPQQVWSEYILVGLSFDRNKLSTVAEDLMCYLETTYYSRKMRPEIPFVLESIRQMGLKIGLISNVNSLGQVPQNLTDYKIIQYFNPIVLSSEYGRRKPDPAIFHHAARLAHTPASACVLVGDRIARDIVGGRKAGFKLVIQIRHDFAHGEEETGAVPDFIINDMTELLEIIKEEQDKQKEQELVQDRQDHPVRAVLFDAGDILYYRNHNPEKFQSFLKELHIDRSPNEFEPEKICLKDRAYRGQITQDEYHEAYLRLYGITQAEQLERGKRILSEEKNDVEFFEGVRQTLTTLKEKGYLLGIVTDTATSVHAKLSWFERAGIGHVWDSIISSKDVGVRKPDPRIYRAVLTQLDIQADEAVFIGHKASELDGARAVGMKTIAFNYEKEAKADYYLDNFVDLLEVPILSR
jgi:HAD superfamily hydrolase (TIGR01509 family)